MGMGLSYNIEITESTMITTKLAMIDNAKAKNQERASALNPTSR